MILVNIITLAAYFLMSLLFVNHRRWKPNVYSNLQLILFTLIFLLFYMNKPMDLGNDYENYYRWFVYVANLEEFTEVVSYRNQDGMLSLYFWLLGVINTHEVYFSIIMVVLIYLLLTFMVKRLLKGYELGLFFYLIAGSRFFLEYSTNTIRSFLASLLLLLFVWGGIQVLRKLRVILYVFISVLTHIKFTISIVVFRTIVDFTIVSRKFTKGIFYASAFIFVMKFAFSFQLSALFGGFLDLLMIAEDKSELSFRHESFDDNTSLTVNLFILILIVFYYSVWLSLRYSKNIDHKHVYAVYSLLVVSFFYPEYVVIERFLQAIFIVTMIMVSKLNLKKYFYLPFVSLNFATLYVVQYQ
jgi:hypothetical protein